VLLRLAYLGITNAFALLRLLPGSDRDKDTGILALRHQLAVLHRQLDGQRVRFHPADRAWLAALLHRLPKPRLHRLRLLVRPDTVLRWRRDLLARRHAAASRPRRRGRPATVRSIRARRARADSQPSARAYRRMPPADEVMAAYHRIGSVAGLADHFGVPGHTVQGWARQLRRHGYTIGQTR
jgi:transposase-like protein